jgi:diaminohydroxyphosphoribosylaminopyrimidine deaminase/5-amino-6-(5-phosphoribosylamino)uracil reductase
MYRCLHLAQLGAGTVAPNPLVGAVLVHDDQIIGEGYHRQFGGPHAEVNCIYSVKDEDREKIPHAVLYVSLEPCAHYGKTPPCTDLIISQKIPAVVIGCRDPFEAVNGKGIEKLRAAGVDVQYGILETQCREINKRFFVYHTRQRPYILLKWAETVNGKINDGTGNRLHISNEYTNRLVHKWRSEEAAILVGTNTALQDDPELTTRYWNGPSPLRAVVDRDLKLPASLKLFNNKQRTIIFNTRKAEVNDNLVYYQVTDKKSLVQQIIQAFYQMNILSVMVEGGAALLQSFINENCWDEARVLTNKNLKTENGTDAPVLPVQGPAQELTLGNDSIKFYFNKL